MSLESSSRGDRRGVENGSALDTDILNLLDPKRLFDEVGRRHEAAREGYRIPAVTVLDQAEFVRVVTDYVRYHARSTDGREVGKEAALAAAAEILKAEFATALMPDGYTAALAAGLGRASGNMPDVVNALARGLKERAIRDHVDATFGSKVDPLSEAERRRFVERFGTRYGEALKRLQIEWDDVSAQASTDRLVRLARHAIRRLVEQRIRFCAG